VQRGTPDNCLVEDDTATLEQLHNVCRAFANFAPQHLTAYFHLLVKKRCHDEQECFEFLTLFYRWSGDRVLELDFDSLLHPLIEFYGPYLTSLEMRSHLLYAVSILACDGYLQLSNGSSPTHQFFDFLEQVPRRPQSTGLLRGSRLRQLDRHRLAIRHRGCVACRSHRVKKYEIGVG
jgi:hypothetical protein